MSKLDVKYWKKESTTTTRMATIIFNVFLFCRAVIYCMVKCLRRLCVLFIACLSHHIAALADLGTLLGSLESIRANWYNFGLQLRVDVGILDGIAVQYSGPLDCLRETLKHWLKTFPNCKWKSIVEALGSPIVGANVLALDLERKHCPQFYQNSSSSNMHPQPICQTLKPTSPHTATYVDQVQVTQYVHMPTVSTYGHPQTISYPNISSLHHKSKASQ